jgi:hypothetical protein
MRTSGLMKYRIVFSSFAQCHDQVAKNRHLTITGHGAVAKKGSHFQVVFRRLMPRLGYQAFLAVAHRLCRMVWKILHHEVRFIEQGCEVASQEKKKPEESGRSQVVGE